MPIAKILIISDLVENLNRIEALLEPVDAELITTNAIHNALSMIETKKQITMLIVDLHQPSFQDLQPIIATGLSLIINLDEHSAALDDEIYKVYPCNNIHFIHKPMSKTSLLPRVGVFLEIHALQNELRREAEYRESAENRAQHLATHDALTDLPNRQGIYQNLDHLIYRSNRYLHSSAVLFIDLDGFKSINDQFGHDAGDQLLMQVSQGFEDITRQTDSVARIGGDEFIVLLTDIEHTNSLITKIQDLLSQAKKPIVFEGQPVSVSASIGIALYPEHGQDPENLIHNSEQAMHQAKKHGKNSFQFFSEDINRIAHRQHELQDNLRKALADDEFSVFYQPIVNVKSGQTVSAEALMRWHSKKLGPVFPDEFIPAAESAGLIQEMGCWVLQQAIEAGVDWHKKFGVSLRLAVNASSIQFRNHLLFDSIKSLITTHNWNPDLLEIEITEGLLLDDSPQVMSYIDEISNFGVRLSVDDFGTGFSALSYLKNYPVNTVKIDRSFIMGLPDDKENAVLVKAIIAMAHGLNLEVIAEGVETLEQWHFLQSLNCDFAQGYYFSKPMAKHDFEIFLMDCAGKYSQAQ